MLNAERNNSSAMQLEINLKEKFPSLIENGRLQVIRPPKSYYDSLDNPCGLKRTFNDSVQRVIWRSKLVLDAVYLLDYCSVCDLAIYT